ncbi:PREDICTED: uncharacterized protein LOC104724597 [Camelina sativa]|uniref:Uncharacterized protein LOC104724597 n=1 Tax=Camelina sativa TaxID=90675 RepID=A0ABM0UHZ6_CAMSA|nr:PREDICTED: uncharacterized protein LOC104724597 [Camelina sativa]
MPVTTRSAWLKRARERLAVRSDDVIRSEVEFYRAWIQRLRAYILASRRKFELCFQFDRVDGTVAYLETMIEEGFFVPKWRWDRLLEERSRREAALAAVEVPDLEEGDLEPLNTRPFESNAEIDACRTRITVLHRYINQLTSTEHIFVDGNRSEGICSYLESMTARGVDVPMDTLEALRNDCRSFREKVDELEFNVPSNADLGIED